jgi:hypothetical protein
MVAARAVGGHAVDFCEQNTASRNGQTIQLNVWPLPQVHRATGVAAL